MLLSTLFKGAPDIEIEQISADSRIPMKNAVFFCMSGIKDNGHRFVKEAVKNGAKVIVYSEELEDKPKAVYIKVKNVSEALKRAANIFYDYPNKNIDTYIVSGTYGRASVAKIIHTILNKKMPSAYIGILGIQYQDKNYKMNFPTLSAIDNIKVLYNLRNEGIRATTFEATGSSLYLKKLDVVSPEVFVFTGCDERSLEYKSSSKEYYNWIRRYLYTLEDYTKIIINCDDSSYDELRDAGENLITYGTDKDADYCISNPTVTNRNISFRLNVNNLYYDITCPLKGYVNIYNLTAAIASLHEMNYSMEDIISSLNDIEDVEGIYQSVDDEYNVYIDCAYDECSVEEIEKFARNITKGRVITVFGTDFYDEESRMSRISDILNKYSDVVILTEDASHEGEVSEILSRWDKFNTKNRFLKCLYRSSAIDNAISLLNSEDVLLILGKGNETFLTMGLGKEKYYGDAYYAIKYIKEGKDEENETEQIY
ncbi:MAG: Mur ligase family protein [Erysipelotrichaceae bacterium]|nr:Mur ligase family protein [Erysipelotrichaceae bacterium]